MWISEGIYVVTHRKKDNPIKIVITKNNYTLKMGGNT